MHKLDWRKLAGLMTIALLVAVIWFGAQVVRRSVNLPHIDRRTLPSQTKTSTNTTGLPLAVPDGFAISTFAEGLERPRVLTFDSQGTLVVSDQKAGAVYALPDANQDGVADTQVTVADNLADPHGLLFLNDRELLIAEEGQIGRWFYDVSNHTAVFDKKITDLPTNGSHVTRTLQKGPNNKLYVSVGSSCNVCHETDPHRATMLRMNFDGSQVERWAWGLRNTVFFVPNPAKPDQFWGNEMGRDLLGDELPPDELNIIPTSGDAPGDYGWPNCYGDSQVDPFGGLSISCQTKTRGSFYDYPAHHAPLGLRFIPEDEGWPKEWEGDLLVSWHGSWNRSEKAGYKVIRLELDDQQKVVAIDDFVTGFLQGKNDVIGRPVDLLFGPGGMLYLSDDGNGRIYRIQPVRP